MIIEMRTYTLKPGNIPTFEERFGGALAIREKFSKLAAFWHTEVGPLNQVIHVWPYDSLDQRASVRAEASKAEGWPPNTRELTLEQRSEIFLPAPFSPPLEPRQLGGIYEIRMYTYAPGTLPAVMERWAEKVPGAHRAVAAGRRLVLGAGRAEQVVPHLGLQGRRRTQPHPRRGGGQGRLAAGRAARRAAEAGEHAGGAGGVLAAEVASGTLPAAPPATQSREALHVPTRCHRRRHRRRGLGRQGRVLAGGSA